MEFVFADVELDIRHIRGKDNVIADAYLVSNGNKLYFPSLFVFLREKGGGGEGEKVRSLAFLQFIHLRVRVLRVCDIYILSP